MSKDVLTTGKIFQFSHRNTAYTGLPTTILQTQRKTQHEALVYLCEYNDIVFKEVEFAGFKGVATNVDGVKVVLQRAEQIGLVEAIFEIQNHFEFVIQPSLEASSAESESSSTEDASSD